MTALLEGSLQKVGKRVRVTAQLINAEDGLLLWSDRRKGGRDCEEKWSG